MADKLWVLPIDIVVSEHEYAEYGYFYGTREDAEAHQREYLEIIWGENQTVYEADYDQYASKDGSRIASPGTVYEFETLIADTVDKFSPAVLIMTYKRQGE